MLIFNFNETKNIYIHIPKNCGRYIRKQIYNNFTCECVNESYPYPVSFKVSNSDGYNLHDTYSQVKDLADNFVTFVTFVTFVRNPYHRIISFFYLKVFENNVFITDTPIIDFLRTPLDILKTKTIESLVSLLKTEFKKYICNNSLICQYKYLFENDNLPNNLTIYKLEEPETFSHFNFKDFNLKEYQLSEYFDNETLQIVNDLFKKDFELFNYQMIYSI
jgi:hypothetical protein